MMACTVSMLLRQWWVPVISAVLVGCQPSSAPPSGTVSTAALVDALRGADRVELGHPGEPPFAQKQGGEVAIEFISQVPLETSAGPFRCDCGPDHRVRFYAGERLLAELSVHRYRSLRWLNGPWASDALIAGEPARAYMDWYRALGGKPAQPRALPSGQLTYRENANTQFLACFPKEALPIAQWQGAMTRTGLDPWRETSKLREVMPDGVALAMAAFRAFGVQPAPWLEDDYRTAVIQTAVEALPGADFTAAIKACAGDEQGLRGAARIYFKLALHQKFDAAFNAEWLPRMAAAQLRSGRPMDKPPMLIQLAATDEPSAWSFLREVARGTRSFPWTTACPLPGDVHMEMMHEPSLPAAAAMLLALHGERVTPKASQPVFGLDQAAAEIAAALLDTARLLRPAHFRYSSHLLAYAAAEALARRPASEATAMVLGAALAHEDYWVRRRIRPIATAAGIEVRREPHEVNLFSAPVAQELASKDPVEAVRLCTEKLSVSRGVERTALLLIRAIAHENQKQAAPAIADFEAALKAGGYDSHAIYRKLAWLKFEQGRLADALRDADASLRGKPDADLYVLRGIIAYANHDFSPATELNFLTAMGLAPPHGYAAIFQHLTAHLGGRPEVSRLRTDDKPRNPTQPPTTITIMPGGSLGVTIGNAALDPWAATVLSFFKDELTAEQLLVRAIPDTPAVPSTQRAEACFYISQKARLAQDSAMERAYLELCVSRPIAELPEYQLAVSRRIALQSAEARIRQ